MFSYLILTSGSVSFFHSTLKELEYPSFVFATEQHTKVRSIPTSYIQLFRASHVQFGGPTKFESLFAMSGDTTFFKLPSLRRNLSVFLDFGLRPTQLSSPRVYMEQNMLVHPKMLKLPVRYASSFCATGFGFRCLTSNELGRIFGLPTLFLSEMKVSAFCFTPTQILDAIFRQFVHHNFGAVPLQRSVIEVLPTPSIVLETSPVFLPGLQRFLPQSWRKGASEVEEKAAKADDAAVPLHLWDKRITCFWPGTEAALIVLRKSFLRCHFRNVFRGYLFYLRKMFSETYLHFLGSNFSFYERKFHVERLGGKGKDGSHPQLREQESRRCI